jgi:hypothetical protein
MKQWRGFAKALGRNVADPEPWEIVVLDWTQDTSDTHPIMGPLAAYPAATCRGARLANSIFSHPYRHIHFIAHSTGAKLANVAAKRILALYDHVQIKTKPFIHLTFLDAFTLSPADVSEYGNMGSDQKHFSEHYFSPGLPFTDTELPNAYNFNLELDSWQQPRDSTEERQRTEQLAHMWPIYWYKNSAQDRGVGYALSREGGNANVEHLREVYPPGTSCQFQRSCASLGERLSSHPK